VGASGEDVSLPALPLADGTTLTLQLHDSSGGCLGSDFDAPSTNDEDEYKAETGE
jgi:hypothetical protein